MQSKLIRLKEASKVDEPKRRRIWVKQSIELMTGKREITSTGGGVQGMALSKSLEPGTQGTMAKGPGKLDKFSSGARAAFNKRQTVF